MPRWRRRVTRSSIFSWSPGDCYVDHPSFGVSIIGRLLTGCGYRVGLVAQPDWRDPEALKVMGRPRIGVGVTSGNMDSMVNIYTVGRRFRKDDCFSENGETGRRPPHALIVYAQLVRQAFPGIRIQLGGLEASFRRIAHYDYWQDKIRPSVLLDSKADILVYGMGERPTPEVFRRFAADEPLDGIRGTARLLGKKAAEAFDPGDRYLFLPSYEETLADRDALMTATIMVEQEMNFQSGRGLLQRYGDRLLVVEPPPEPLKPEELDRVHELPYARRPHPKYKGRIPAYETIKDSIQAVRGCPRRLRVLRPGRASGAACHEPQRRFDHARARHDCGAAVLQGDHQRRRRRGRQHLREPLRP